MFTTYTSNKIAPTSIMHYSVLLLITLAYINAINSEVHNIFSKLGSGLFLISVIVLLISVLILPM